MRAYDSRTADCGYGPSSKGLFPSFCCDWSLSARKKTGQVLPCPGNSILRLKGNQDSHHTRFALLTFFRADSLRGEAIRLSEKPSVAAFIRVTDSRAHALLRMRGAPEGHRPRLDSGRREPRSFVSFVAVTSPDRKENWR